jgi:S-adenosylmethionine:tRNA ribosyltransferase-isomerase
VLESFARRRIGFATLTHAAGLSSTGDPALDAMLPFDEAYTIPPSTARLINRARARGSRIVAVGTSVVRALEHAANDDGKVREGEGLAMGKLGAGSRLRVVDALLTGTHEPGTSHHELLRAFVPDATLDAIDAELDRYEYRTHEFGDSVLLERAWDICAGVGAHEMELSLAVADSRATDGRGSLTGRISLAKLSP